MPRATGAPGATGDQSKPQGPPCLGGQEYHRVARSESRTSRGFDGLTHTRGALKRGGPGANSPMSSEFAQLMEEPPGGPNHGHRASDNPEREGRQLPLGAEDWAAAEFARAGGWTIITDVPGGEARGGGWQRSGGTTHRGVLHPDEHVDNGALLALVEAEFGHTREDVHSVYRQGPLSDEKRQLRDVIDARVLALSRSGANVALLGRALGFPVKDNGNCRAMENALARARQKETS